MVGGPDGGWIGPLARPIKALVLSRFVSQNLVMVLAKRSKEDLTIMRELMEAGKVTPVIDKRYRLSEVPEAIRYLEEGHARGKVVITLDYHNKTLQRAAPDFAPLRFAKRVSATVRRQRHRDDVGSAVHCECRYMGSGRLVPHGNPLKMKNARYISTS